MKAEDIDLAVGSSKTSESPEHKHNILDVIKDVFDAASEGKGIEDIIKSFKKMEKNNKHVKMKINAKKLNLY